MKQKEFEELVSRALEDLPEEFLKRLENVDIVTENRPSKRFLQVRRVKGGSLLLGLYCGIPQNKRGSGYSGVLPDKIIIYQEALESICKNREELRTKVREVVIHEIGHHFGMSERKIREAERCIN